MDNIKLFRKIEKKEEGKLFFALEGKNCYSDWFLPSRDELNLMCTNLKVFGVGGFSDLDYWSSSEKDAGNAWTQKFEFGDGSQHDFPKTDDLHRVRAVRTF